MFDRLSIRAKLLAVIVLTAVVALSVAGIAIVAYDSVSFRRQMRDDLSTQARMLGAISSAALAFDDAKAAREYLATLSTRPAVEAAAIYDSRGAVFARYQKVGTTPTPLPALEAPGYRIEGDHLLLFEPIRSGDETVGTVYLRQAMDLRGRMLRYAGLVLLVFLVALALALLLSARMQALLSGPILDMAGVARKVVEQHDYSIRVDRKGEDEVGVLSEAFNQMLNHIQQREAALQSTNQALQVEIGKHKAATDKIADLNQNLEQRVADRTAALEASNKELESFSYSVSHDLRAPLRGIDGFTALLESDLEDALTEKQRGYINRVRSASHRMGHLIDDLLKLSRTSRSDLVREPLDLSEVAEEILHGLQSATPGRKAHFIIEPRMMVSADRHLLRTALENLLGNAWKFTGKREEARIEVGRMERDGQPTFFIRDNGAGFDMKYVDKLFGAFQRLHGTADFEGTGVGLANVQRILRRHGGAIWAEGVPDEGATFFFTLPSTGDTP